MEKARVEGSGSGFLESGGVTDPTGTGRVFHPARGSVPWRDSLQFKLGLLTLGIALAFIWAGTFYALATQQAQLEALQKEQLLISGRYIAAELDQKLGSRLADLALVASNLDTGRLYDRSYLRNFLKERTLLQKAFSAGISVIGMDGHAIEDFPMLPGRRGTFFGDREYFRQAVATRKSYIHKPIMGRILRRPVLIMSAPVMDSAGEVRAVLTGTVDLNAQDVTGLVTDSRIFGRTELYLLSVQDETVIASTDGSRVMEAIAMPKTSEVMDHIRAGFEGSMVSRNSRGTETLFSVSRLSGKPDWAVVQALPAEVAFEPVHSLRQTVILGAVTATVLAFLVIAWLSRRILVPLKQATEDLEAMSSGREPIRRLEEKGDAELRTLLASFNRLTALLQARQADLCRNEKTYRSLFENMLNGFAYCRLLYEAGEPRDCLFLSVNPAFEALTGLKDVAGRRASEVMPGVWDNDPEMLDAYARVARSGEPEYLEIYGETLGQWFALSIYSPELDHFVTVFDIISERKEQQEKIARLVRIHSVLSGINSAIVRIHDRQALLDAACQVAVDAGRFGMAWIGLLTPGGQTLCPVAGRGIDLESIRDIPVSVGGEVPRGQGTAHEALTSRRAVFCNDITAAPQVGPVRAQALKYGYRSVCALPLVVDGVGIGVMGLYAREPGFFDEEEMKLLDELAADISFALQYIEREERLDYLAYYDVLTGLPNRTLFLDRLGQMIHGSRDGGQTIAVIVLDLEHFGHVNETYGRHVGDALLKEVAGILAVTVREPRSLARTGADTFAVAVGGLQHGAEAAVVVQHRIFDALGKPFMLAGTEILVSAHAGIAIYPDDAGDGEDLYRCAEAALREAQSSNRRCLYYAPQINARITATLALERELRTALDAGQFVMHYQPRVDLLSGGMVGAEALIRWQHPERGVIPPGEFIPVAERSGLIVPIGAWVIDNVCAQQAAWLAEGIDIVPVAVNLSPVQFAHGNLLPTLDGALARHGLDAKYLELELTESLVMKDPEEAAETMRGFRQVGLRLSLDDFGTGYSSLAYLQRFPFDFVKIDRTFVSDITQNPRDAAIATAVIAMAHRLNLRVVAEGVETDGQLCYLRQHGCDQIQGYYFSPPVPAASFGEMQRAGKRLGFDDRPSEGVARTVLIVDDEPSILAALHRILRREGYRVLKASCGQEGLEILAANPVQVIVSDQRMPGMSGSEFLSIVKELHPETIRIILSGYTDLQTVTDAVNRGAVYKFLTKPWDDDLLKENIRDAFLRYQPNPGGKRLLEAKPAATL